MQTVNNGSYQKLLSTSFISIKENYDLNNKIPQELKFLSVGL